MDHRTIEIVDLPAKDGNFPSLTPDIDPEKVHDYLDILMIFPKVDIVLIPDKSTI